MAPAYSLSRNKLKFLISLQNKKVRDEEKLFLIEGDKLVRELLMTGTPVVSLIAKPEFLASVRDEQIINVRETLCVSYEDLKRISSLRTPHNAMAVVEIPENIPDYKKITESLVPVLDFIQDPGNMGTIIRAAAWFGIRNIICSMNCVDLYNPKVIQASMGAFMHVKVFYSDITGFLRYAKENGVEIYGAMLEGEPIYDHTLGKKGVILIGNESKGISGELIPFITERIMIPGFCNSKYGIDSLNAGMAASVIFSEFARRNR